MIPEKYSTNVRHVFLALLAGGAGFTIGALIGIAIWLVFTK